MGPQQPSTPRSAAHFDGSWTGNVGKGVHDIGLAHRKETACEDKTYSQAITLTDRMDYMNPMGNNLVVFAWQWKKNC